MKNVRDQIQRLAKRDNYFIDSQIEESGVSTKEDMKTKKKKALAKKLIEEKERLINEGLKQRLKDIESEKAERMMKIALDLDP